MWLWLGWLLVTFCEHQRYFQDRICIWGIFWVLGFATLPIQSILPAAIFLSIGYIEVTLVSLPRLSQGVLAEVSLWVSWPGRGQTTQSLYALKMGATIIGYIPSLVAYGSLKPLLGETYLLHSGDHISSPWFACILAVDFLRSVLFVH